VENREESEQKLETIFEPFTQASSANYTEDFMEGNRPRACDSKKDGLNPMGRNNCALYPKMKGILLGLYIKFEFVERGSEFLIAGEMDQSAKIPLEKSIYFWLQKIIAIQPNLN